MPSEYDDVDITGSTCTVQFILAKPQASALSHKRESPAEIHGRNLHVLFKFPLARAHSDAASSRAWVKPVFVR